MNSTQIEDVFRTADPSWWNPAGGQDSRFWLFQKQAEYVERKCREHFKASSPLKGLDAGCGRGIHSQMLTRLGCSAVTSLDINPAMLALTSKVACSTRVEGSLMEMPFGPNEFDLVVSLGTSMHVPSVPRLFFEIYRVLVTGGIAAISMANALSMYTLWTTRSARF